MSDKHIETAKRVAERAARLSVVEAVALAGSSATGNMTDSSDIDVYIYPTRDLTMDERNTIAAVDSRNREVIDYWGPGDVWFDTQTDVEVDAVYFSTSFIEEQLRSTIDQHQARMGYTTAFWHTVKVSQILYDRNGWFADLLAKANQPYPDELAQSIIQTNYPLLRDIIPSYKHKIEKSLKRNDRVSVNRDVHGLLDSYFDILFAINRMLHPGEKRLISAAGTCEIVPNNMQSTIESLIENAGNMNVMTVQLIDELVDNLDVCLNK